MTCGRRPARALDGLATCRDCAVRSAATLRERAERGICRHCPQEAAPGRKACQACLDLANDRYRENAPAITATNRRRYLERRADGLCVRCGEPAEPGRSRCEGCLKLARLDQAARKERAKREAAAC